MNVAPIRAEIQSGNVCLNTSADNDNDAGDAEASVVYYPSQPSGGGSASLTRVGGALQPNAGDPYPFIGLTLVGPAHEADHLRDYQKEAALAERLHQTQLKRRHPRSIPTTLTEALLDGRYQRYLTGK